MSYLTNAIKKHKIISSIIVVALLFWGGHAMYGNSAHALPGGSDHPVPVVVQTMAEQEVRTWSDFSGRLLAVDYAEIRPEVSGKITEIHFEDGQTVKKGATLFVIDPRPYAAEVAKAEANLATAKTNAQFARIELDRANGLIKTQAIAQRVYDERANAVRVANANINEADAVLKQAQLNLEYAYVRAPISGRVSRAEITVGNLVQSGPNAPLLTSIVSNDGIYADFEVDEPTYMQTVHSDTNGKEQESHIPVELTVQGSDKDRVYKGHISTFDNHIDTASGTIRARAKFSNEDGSLVPGMFVSVRMGSTNKGNTLLVLERAIGIDQNKKFVYVVSKDNKVEYREIAVGKQVDDKRIVLSGLNVGDRVIVDGLQMVRPGSVVDAKELAATQDATPAPKS